jgi:hypothetical protein
MNQNVGRGTLLGIPLIEERYGKFFFASLAFHGILIVLVLFGRTLIPSSPISIVSGGPKGGGPGDMATVGLVDLKEEKKSGGEGMYKRPLIDQPPVAHVKERPEEKRNPITFAQKQNTKTKPARDTALNTSIIPVASRPGTGGVPQSNTGKGGGSGGGIGTDIGNEAGGFGADLYRELVAARIDQDWSHPAAIDVTRIEIQYTFKIRGNGLLYDITPVRLSGHKDWDSSAEETLRALADPSNRNPLPPPTPGNSDKTFRISFVYPK